METPRFPAKDIEPQKTVTEYSTSIVKASLAYADQRLRCQDRKISPLAAKVFIIYKQSCIDFLRATDHNVRDVYAANVKAFEEAIDGCIYLRGRSCRYSDGSEMVPKLLAWKRLQLAVRYGDYITRIASDLNIPIGPQKTPSQDEIDECNVYWLSIENELKKETPAWRQHGTDNKEQCKMHLAFMRGGVMLHVYDTNELEIVTSYSLLKKSLYLPFDATIDQGCDFKRAFRLFQDSRELEKVIDPADKWTETILRVLLEVLIDEYFITRDIGIVRPDVPRSWRGTAKLCNRRTTYLTNFQAREAHRQQDHDNIRQKTTDKLRQFLEKRAAFLRAEELATAEEKMVSMGLSGDVGLTLDLAIERAERQKAAFDYLIYVHPRPSEKVRPEWLDYDGLEMLVK